VLEFGGGFLGGGGGGGGVEPATPPRYATGNVVC